ncbi:Cytochrome P450 [Popillia japonica]|uniref:Cytochrome P450 n=1 Tax=Popillia japonica TaxID=7064 RepID=A0AAW1MF16_POPJA
MFIGVAKTDIFDLVCKYMRIFGPAPFRTWNGSKPGVHLMRPEHLEVIMASSVHIKKSHQYDLTHPWLGLGLLTSSGARWHQHRKLITPSFHFKILENFMHTIEEKAQILLDNLDKKTDGKPHDIYQDIAHCALDIICETAMGVNVNAMSDTNNEYIQAIYTMSEIIAWKMIRPYIPEFIFNILPQGYKSKQALKVLHGFSENIISSRKKLLQTKPSKNKKESDAVDELLGVKKRLSLLDMLLEASEDGKVLSDTDIRQEVDSFIFAGHDTTAASIAWTLLLLGTHPEIQENLYQELKIQKYK